MEICYPLDFMPNFSEKKIPLGACKIVAGKGPFVDLILERSA